MRAHLRDNAGHFRLGLQEQCAQRLRFGNAIPWIESLVEIRSRGMHGIPEDRVYGLEKARPPRGNSQLAAWANLPPKFPESRLHVRHEEDAEDTDNSIEPGRR